MKIVVLLLSIAFLFGVALDSVFASPAGAKKETVVLLHGLTRTKSSMAYLKYRLTREGYEVVDISYPSRKMPPEELVAFVDNRMRDLGLEQEERVHFVTHSLGGLIVRGLSQSGWQAHIGRVVMLGPPNHGSELVDVFGEVKMFRHAFGLTGKSLGTKAEDFPNRLEAAQFELGVIAGNRSINPVGSFLLPGDDDGFVSVDAARLRGMTDFIVLPVNHSTLILNPVVADQTVSFLSSGAFERRDSDLPVKTPPRSL